MYVQVTKLESFQEETQNTKDRFVLTLRCLKYIYFYRIYYVMKKMQIKFLMFGAILYNFLLDIFTVICYRDSTVWH